jgi:hypothetical protein
VASRGILSSTELVSTDSNLDEGVQTSSIEVRLRTCFALGCKTERFASKLETGDKGTQLEFLSKF